MLWSVYEVIRPTDAQRPRMYGLPKIHKKNTPLCPILSMIGSAQHELAKYLSFILQPVLDLYSFTNCVKNSFIFAPTIRNLSPKSTFLCSVDINSLFPNISLDETINICAEVLYNSDLTPPSFSKDTFCQLMHSATKFVEFSFDNITYQEIDGVVMSSPLGRALAIF